ncbi:unnamed protein product [marine sediment metagenome]|uniref:Uncharacterized protein n=1 Tax=marine sediment metagenome TaxID=412755 RepID=X1HVK2_9ZZZZ
MELAENNKNIRKELEIINKNLFGISSINYIIQDYLNNEQKALLRQKTIKFIKNNFSCEQINGLYDQIKDMLFIRNLDHEIKELLKQLVEDFSENTN